MRRFTTGMETGDLVIWDFAFATGGTASCAASTTLPRSGTYSLRIRRTTAAGTEVGVATFDDGAIQEVNTGGTPNGAWIQASNTTDEMWVRCYMRFTTLSDATANCRLDLLQLFDSTFATVHFRLRMKTSGALVAWDVVGTETAIFTPATATWYKVVVHLKKTGASDWSWDVEFYDESTKVTTTASGSNAASSTADISSAYFCMAPYDPGAGTGQGGGNVDFHYDDIAINDSRGSIARHNTAPRPGAVVGAYVPTATGTVEFADETTPLVGGTALFSNIDEWPAGAIDTADYNINPVGTTAVKDLFTCGNYAGTTNGVVQALQVYYYVADGVGSDGLGFFGGVQDSGGNVLEGVSGWPGSGGASDPEVLNGVCVGGTGAALDTAWTNTEFDAVQFTYRRQAVPATEFKRIFAVAMEMEDQVPIPSLPHNPPITRSTLIRR